MGLRVKIYHFINNVCVLWRDEDLHFRNFQLFMIDLSQQRNKNISKILLEYTVFLNIYKTLTNTDFY